MIVENFCALPCKELLVLSEREAPMLTKSDTPVQPMS